MPKQNHLPAYHELMIPTLEALKLLGGSGAILEINEKVITALSVEDDDVKEVHYRLGWARTYLKKFGLIDNSSRGVWALVDAEIDINAVDKNEIVKTVRELTRLSKNVKEEFSDNESDELRNDWKNLLLKTILNISPDAFERLTQRLLRENGFTQVEITGKTGDGGIDGKGIVKLNDFLSFHVIFQCKRYKESISPNQIRDFRGAMQGRTDKGIFITTGTFTRDAVKEATRDGAPPIELIDGDLLCEKLKESQLGVETQVIEQVDIKIAWFDKL